MILIQVATLSEIALWQADENSGTKVTYKWTSNPVSTAYKLYLKQMA